MFQLDVSAVPLLSLWLVNLLLVLYVYLRDFLKGGCNFESEEDEDQNNTKRDKRSKRSVLLLMLVLLPKLLFILLLFFLLFLKLIYF